MKTPVFGKKALLSVLALTFGCLTAFAGGEHYRVYLNKALLFEKSVNEPMSVINLLDKAGSSDEIVIYYSHCGRQGNGRKVSLKNSKGTTVKEWSFSEAKEGMAIPVKEIAALQKQYGELTLQYASRELPGGRALASLNGNGKTFAVIALNDVIGRFVI